MILSQKKSMHVHILKALREYKIITAQTQLLLHMTITADRYIQLIMYGRRE